MILNFDTFISSEFIEEISSLMEDIGRKEGRKEGIETITTQKLSVLFYYSNFKYQYFNLKV